ncbi:MAG: MATE family efflux transporter [Lachnospiraceae bacterium]
MQKKQFYKEVWSLMLPLALQNLINVGISSIDVIMLGKVGENVLSGASLGSQINFIMSLVLFGIMSGASVLTAQYWGKQNMEAIKKIFGIAMKVSAAVGILFFAVTMCIPGTLMQIFTNDPTVIAYGVQYLRIVCVSYLVVPVTMTYLNMIRNMEQVIIATVVYLTSMVVNIIVNLFLIFGFACFPKMGIRGAAIGTLTARLVELLIVFVYDRTKNHTMPFHLSYLRMKDALMWKDFKHYSLPVMANELFWGAGVSTISAVLGHLGSPVVAANSVAQVVRQLAMVIAFGASGAAAIMIGKVIGEGKHHLAEVYAKEFVKISILTGILGGIVVLLTRPIVMSQLDLTETARGYLGFMMYIMSYFVVGQSLNTTIVVGICRGGGDTRFGLILDMTFLWGVAILGGFLTAFVWKLGVYVTYIVLLSDEIIKVPVTVWRFCSKKWLRDVTRE